MMYWRFTIKSLLLLLASLGHFCEGYTESQNQCITTMSNGCSAPEFNGKRIHNRYSRAIFVPACDRHDICYHCGKTLSWSRKDCDDAFYTNMISICEGKLEPYHKKRSFFSKIVNKARQTNHLLKATYQFYLKTDKGTLDECYKAAKLFYFTVRLFGKRYFKPNDRSDPNVVCHFGCTDELGSPK